MSIIALAAATATACAALLGQPIDPARPYKQTGQFELVKDYTFGRHRQDATVDTRAKLDQEFFYRYIYENGKLDGLKTYWSYHRDYPDGDARSLHVFDDCTLTLKARIPPGGGLRPRGLESGMLRGKVPITEGMYIEMRTK